MTLKAILVDTESCEIVLDSMSLAANFNDDNPDLIPMTAEDRDDLNDMFLDVGLLTEIVAY